MLLFSDGLKGQNAFAVIEKRRHCNHSKKTLGRLLTVEGAVLFLCDPKLVQQHCQFPGHQGFLASILTAPCHQM